MEIVIVERQFATPVSADGLRAADAAAQWCLAQHRCRPVFHLLRHDGRRLCCVFQAPDVEAIRRTVRSLGMSEPDMLWRAALDAPRHDVARLGETAAQAAAEGRLVVVDGAPDEPETTLAEAGGRTALGRFVALDGRRLLALQRRDDGPAGPIGDDQPEPRPWPAVVITP